MDPRSRHDPMLPLHHRPEPNRTGRGSRGRHRRDRNDLGRDRVAVDRLLAPRSRGGDHGHAERGHADRGHADRAEPGQNTRWGSAFAILRHRLQHDLESVTELRDSGCTEDGVRGEPDGDRETPDGARGDERRGDAG